MKVLLHICCSVCATSVIERLRSEGHDVVGLFYNPNIHPHEEYQKRLAEAKKVAEQMNFELVEGEYNTLDWFRLTDSYKNAPEGEKRCNICFEMRLKYTWKYLRSKNFDMFTTTLTVSPHKKSSKINEIGQNIGNSLFLAADFKKKDGFNRAIQLAKEMNLYHQHYCGCKYSMK